MHDIRTLAGPASLDVEIKRSRFLAQATRCDSADEALAWLAEVSDPDATHNCWAWRIGQQYRFNDDGEPGGSAGRPILAAIEGQGLDHVVAVVTRWFGGVKLGVGGLVRAYGGSVAQCLQQAEQTVLIAKATLQIHCDFALEPSLRQLIEQLDGDIDDVAYGSDGIDMRIQLPLPHIDALRDQLRDLSRGQATVKNSAD
ncbi:MAG: YigZ family protein [Xanthomonadales bacterium]|nr:YigZ family protein [Xanthomonadales bacterium]